MHSPLPIRQKSSNLPERNELSHVKTQVILDDNMLVAAEIIKNGGLLAVPTETVYGLAANGLDGGAVQKIYDVKNRPETKPISLLVSGMEDVEKFCEDIPKAAYKLAEIYWPGPLTMVLKKSDRVPEIVTAGGDTVGVRCPDHQKTLTIIRLCGVPLAAPSANLSGAPSPKCLSDVLHVFQDKIEGAVNGGRCTVGIESTIVDLTTDPPVLLRAGGLAWTDIQNTLFEPVL